MLAKADTRTAVEGQVFPSRAQRLPAFRLVFVGIGTVQIFSSMHYVGRVANHGALGNEERILAVRAATAWENGIADREAGVTWHDRVRAECYLDVNITVQALAN